MYPDFKKVYPGNWGILWGCSKNFWIANMCRDSTNYSKKISFVPRFLKKCTRGTGVFCRVAAKIFRFLTCVEIVQTILKKISFVPRFFKKCTRGCKYFNGVKAKIFAYSEGTNEVQTILVEIMVNTYVLSV